MSTAIKEFSYPYITSRPDGSSGPLDDGCASDATRALLQKWGNLHAVRSVLRLAASIVFLASIL